MLFKLSNLNSNLALTLGYLNLALNNSAWMNIYGRFRLIQNTNFKVKVSNMLTFEAKCKAFLQERVLQLASI